jgi:Tfp pilus assembly protein PilF
MAAYFVRCREDGRTCLMYLHGLEGLGVSCLVTQFSLENRRVIDGPLIWLAGRQPDGREVPTGELLAQAMWAFGITGSDLGTSVAQLANAYQRVSRGRKFMLVVDDLVSVPQIVQLVPNDAPDAVIVATTPLKRRTLQAEGFAPFTPEYLPDDAARRLFRHVLGETAALLDEPTVHELVSRCGGFPLLVKVLAAQIAGRPRVAARLLSGLRAAKVDLLALDDERRMTRCLDVAYQNLTPGQAEAYRRSSLLPGPEFVAETAATALDADPDETAAVLDDLVDYNLLTFVEPDRYCFHPIIRDDAHSRAEADDDPQTRRDVVARALNWLLREALPRGAAVSKRWWVDPVQDLMRRLCGDVVPEYSREDALRWFDVEWPNLVAGVRAAHRHGLHEPAWSMCVALWKYLHIHGLYDAWIDSHRDGLASARAEDNPAGVLQLSSQLGAAYLAVGEYGRARECFEESLEAARALPDSLGKQSALEWLGKVAAAERKYRLALEYYHRSWDVLVNAGDRISAEQKDRAFALLRLQQARAFVALEEWDSAEVDAVAARDYFDSQDRETDNRGKCRLALGRAVLGAGDSARAVAVLGEALSLFEQDNSGPLQAETHCLLGRAWTAAGRRDHAARSYRKALEYHDSVGSPHADAVRAALADLDT